MDESRLVQVKNKMRAADGSACELQQSSACTNRAIFLNHGNCVTGLRFAGKALPGEGLRKIK
jgi:hypothetical protein